MSRKIPLVVTHYTRNTSYEKVVRRLLDSLDELELERSVTATDSLGSWRANSNFCAEVVRRALHDNPERDVLRVDADAVFHERPTIFERDDFDADVAAHVHDFRWHPNELLGGTLFFRNTPTVRTLVNEWATLACCTRKTERNGDLLQELLGHYPHVKFFDLPPEYCKIFDKMDGVTDPVIEHFQVSRRYKQEINGRPS